MRFAAFVAAVLLSTVAAQAQFPGTASSHASNPQSFVGKTKFVPSGGKVLLWQGYSLNPDCSSLGPITVKLVQSPGHGTVTDITTKVFPNFPANNPHSICNTRKVPGQRMTYASSGSFTGQDLVEIEAFFPDGSAQVIRIPIIVR